MLMNPIFQCKNVTSFDRQFVAGHTHHRSRFLSRILSSWVGDR